MMSPGKSPSSQDFDPGALDPADPRFHNGIPPAQQVDEETFILHSGMLRRRPAAALRAPEDRAPESGPDAPQQASNPPQGAPDRLTLAQSHLLEASTMDPAAGLIARRRQESSSHLMEAEQLLQRLERRPLGESGGEPSKDAWSLPKSLRSAAEGTAWPRPRLSEGGRTGRGTKSGGRLFKWLLAAALFTAAAWLAASYLVEMLRPRPVETPAEGPAGKEAPPMVRQDITPPTMLDAPSVPLPE